MSALRSILDRLRAPELHAPDTETGCQHAADGDGLGADYEELIAGHFRRWSLSEECLAVRARRIGTRSDGFDVYVATLTLKRWERATALHVLLGLPLLDAKIRRLVGATWLADYSHFAGLWLHPAGDLVVPRELKDLLKALVPEPVTGTRDADSRGFSLPSDLMSLPPNPGKA